MNKNIILTRLETVLMLLEEAEKTLREISQDASGLISYDATDFADQVAEIISCDHGKAGLIPLLEKIR